jgi:Flp pilus assembly protein CpaB
MENMRVLATDAAVTRAADGRPTPSTVVMIEVTPEESELLAAATSRGQIQLVLRGFAEQGDSKKVNASTAAAMLLDGAPPAPTRAPRASPRVAAPPPRPAEPVVVAPVPLVVTTPVAPKSDSVTVQVWRGKTKTNEKLTKDTIKRDTIRP